MELVSLGIKCLTILRQVFCKKERERVKNNIFSYMLLVLAIVGIAALVKSNVKAKKGNDMAVKPFLFQAWKYPFELPKLPYAYNALEPHIDTETMTIHHTKHHQGYVNNLNAALEKHADLQSMTIEELLINLNSLPAEVKTAIQNNGGGHFNHSMFWELLTPKSEGKPSGVLLEAINSAFGSFEAFQEEFNKAAKTRFGSGWAWLSLDASNKLVVTSSANQDCPLSDGLRPVLGLDVWEHAYYLQYQNRRPEYIAAWWSILNWAKIAENYDKALSAK